MADKVREAGCPDGYGDRHAAKCENAVVAARVIEGAWGDGYIAGRRAALDAPAPTDKVREAAKELDASVTWLFDALTFNPRNIDGARTRAERAQNALRDALRAALDAADARPADNDSPVPTGQPKGGDVDCAPHAVTSCKVNTNASERVGSNAGPGTDNPARPTPSASCDLCGATDPADRRMAGNVNDRYPCPRPFHSPTPPAADASGAEAMAWPDNVACGHCGHHPNQHAANGCEAVCHNPEDNPDECGCRETFARLPLPATDDAGNVERAKCGWCGGQGYVEGSVNLRPYRLPCFRCDPNEKRALAEMKAALLLAMKDGAAAERAAKGGERG